MLAFHFTAEQHGLEDIAKRRLKVATYDDLNDPFEHLAPDLKNLAVQLTFTQLKAEMAAKFGLLCFSRGWQNPVQWSHYANKHHGLCLGFEIPEKKLAMVTYSPNRVSVKMEQVLNAKQLDRIETQRWFFTKYRHWEYEDEVRIPVLLGQKFENGLYFAPFGEDLKLVQIIVGAESAVSRALIRNALGKDSEGVLTFKAVLSDDEFKVIRPENEQAWA